VVEVLRLHNLAYGEHPEPEQCARLRAELHGVVERLLVL
jgi:hypothetical protein